MVNASLRPFPWVLAPAAAILILAAWLRGAEYDEQYTLFLTAGTPRPDWPMTAFPAALARDLQSGHASLARIGHDLRVTDVHPPLYFWLVSLWRGLTGEGLFAARLFSVLTALVSLALTGVIARLARVPVAPAMLLTLGCYGFTYTSVVARGFAQTQMLLLGGVVCLMLKPRVWRFALAGALFGAAMLTNYLSVFVAGACLLVVMAEAAWGSAIGDEAVPIPSMVPAASRESKEISPQRHEAHKAGKSGMFRWLPLVFQRPSLCAQWFSLCAQWFSLCARRLSLCALCLCGAFSLSSHGQGADSHQTPRLPPLPALAALLAFLAFLPATLWWFLAQRGSREGQFPPFSLLPSLLRLARQGAGAVLGGLPLYVEGGLSLVLAAGLSLILLALAAWIVWRWSRIGTPRARTLFGLAAMAPALGLLVLGVLFNNTPIEVRYLAFSTPFVALLLAGALPPPGRAGLLAVMAASIAGLMLAPQTMQPMRAAARAAAALMGNAPGRNGPREEGVVLLPRGNDGVGVVGTFAIESPPAQYLLVIAAGETPEHIRARLHLHRRVALALLEQDAASRAASEAMRDALTHPSWREVARSGLIAVYERTGGAAARFTEPHDRREHEHR